MKVALATNRHSQEVGAQRQREMQTLRIMFEESRLSLQSGSKTGRTIVPQGSVFVPLLFCVGFLLGFSAVGGTLAPAKTRKHQK